MEVYFKRQTVISFPDNTSLEDITTGIADGSLMIDEVLFTDRFTIGTCNSNRFEVELYDFDTIGNEKIYVYQNVWDSEEDVEPREVPLFTGYVDSCITNRGRFEDSKHIVAYDAIQKYSNVDVAAWWEQVFDTEIQVTVKTLRDSLCDFVGIDYEDVTLPNDDVYIKQTQQINTASFISMLTYIMQVNACNAHMDRSGVLRFITISDNSPIDVTDTYAQNTTEFDDYTIPPYYAVRITNSTENVVAVSGGEINYLDITDNVLLLDKTTQELIPIAEAIFLEVTNVEYKPATIDMIVSDLNVQVGDKVLIDGNTYLVCEQTLSGSQFVDHQINSIGQSTLEESSAEYNATQKDIQNKISASSLKYYRFQNNKAIAFSTSSEIINIRYSCAEDGVVIFHGCVIFDLERIDTTQPASVEMNYSIGYEVVREYTPTDTYYHDGRYTFNLLHFWEASANRTEHFIVTLVPTNCRITIGAYREEGYMEGMGLIGESIWNGLIEIEDNFGEEITLITTPTSVDAISGELALNLIQNIVLSLSDSADTVSLNTVPVPEKNYTGKVKINKNTNVIHGNMTWGDLKQITWQDANDDYAW